MRVLRNWAARFFVVIAILALTVARSCNGQRLYAIGSSAAIAADCGTTLHAIRIPQTVETNPLLGSRPSSGRILATCAVGFAINLELPRLLFPRSPTARRLWLAAIAAVELTEAVHNARIR